MKKMVSAALLFVFAVATANAQSPVTPNPRDLTWLDDKIAESKNNLDTLKLSYGNVVKQYTATSTYSINRKGKKVRATRRTPYYDWAWKEVGLAVLEPVSGNLSLIKIRKDRQNLYVETPGWEVNFERNEADRRWNSFNTAFTVLDPQDKKCVVIALKWVLGPEIISYRKEKIGRKKVNTPVFSTTVKESLYIPYSRGLHLRPAILRGREHFKSDNAEAYRRLNQLGVRSLIGRTDLVTKRFEPVVFEELVQIEHSDPEEYRVFKDAKGTEKISSPAVSDITAEMLGNIKKYEPIGPHERVWGRFGFNGHSEFNHISNFAGAVGAMQFTNNGKFGTWDIVRSKYPLARLPGFREGATDHIYSIMAAICLHDYNTSILVQAFGEEILNDPELEHYLAAAYNGGIGNVAKSIRKGRQSGIRWYHYLPKQETRTYVEELDFLKSHRTPK